MKKTNKCSMYMMPAILAALVFISVISCASVQSRTQKAVSEKSNSVTTSTNPVAVRSRPLMGGYFRTWHDAQSWLPDNAPNMMGEVPKEVDILFVFHDWTEPDSPFWKTLKEIYVPKLNAQGTQVVRTIGFEFLIGEKGILNDTKYTSAVLDEQLYDEMAEKLITEYVTKDGINGLDIDIEYHNFNTKTKMQQEKGIKVFLALAKRIGPKGIDTSKLLIMDTNFCEGNAVISKIAGYIDFLLLQAYGKTGEARLAANWQAAKAHIKPEQFMIGFSFYEENSNNRWGDITEASGNSVSGTRAERYALWQPNGGKDGQKAGIFSYAVERDGVAFGNNKKFIKTEYPWTKVLAQIMKKAAVHK